MESTDSKYMYDTRSGKGVPDIAIQFRSVSQEQCEQYRSGMSRSRFLQSVPDPFPERIDKTSEQRIACNAGFSKGSFHGTYESVDFSEA
jgi:hypothetical protein